MLIEKMNEDANRQAIYLDDGSGNLQSVAQQALPDSGLWIGCDLYLEREDVEELKQSLVHWLHSGRLF